jgi:hypothetical protein
MARMLVAGLLLSLLGCGPALAQGSCAAKAVSKEGKPLAGPARTSFIKKCCEESAVDSNGQRLAGRAKANYVKKCEADASYSAPPPRG